MHQHLHTPESATENKFAQRGGLAQIEFQLFCVT